MRLFVELFSITVGAAWVEWRHVQGSATVMTVHFYDLISVGIIRNALAGQVDARAQLMMPTQPYGALSSKQALATQCG
jgi:hypothetical protein